MNSRAMLKPALLGGLVMGVLSGLPGVSIGNCCCCAWIIVGGVVAAYLLQSWTPEPITLGDGALVGLLAGLVGAVVSVIVSVPMTQLLGPFQQQLLSRLAESQQSLPPEVQDAIDNFGAQGLSAGRMFLTFVMMLVLGSIFSSLGGLLGAFFFKKKVAPAPPPPFAPGPTGPYIDGQ